MPDGLRRTVLVTGGTGTVGQALVVAFCREEYSVTFQYRSNENQAERLRIEHGASPLRLDFNQTTSVIGEYDIVVHSAGVNIQVAPLHRVDSAAWEQTLRINLVAVWDITRACLPAMLRRNWGRIITISSVYGHRAEEDYGPYNISKHALHGFTKSVARDYARSGITANAICPGPIDSPMLRRNRELWAQQHGQTFEEYLSELLANIPTGHLTRAEDVAELAIFLASDSASNITGTTIAIDGGILG